jgi:ABC-type sugar transport system substrate-binding protein
MDDDEPTREFLGMGYIDAIVGQRPFIQGYIAMKLLTEALLHKHKKPQAAPPIEYDILLNENISQFDNAAYFETIFRSL